MSKVTQTYPIVLRIVQGHIEASQPDLDIYRVRGRIDEIRSREEIGTIVMDLWQEISRMIQSGKVMKPPRGPRETLPTPKHKLMSTGAVAGILGVSTETVRRMCKAGKLDTVVTAGGHSKIRMTDPFLRKFLPVE